MQLIGLQEIAFFDVTRTGELLNRLSEDTQVIKNASTTNLSEALRSLATAVIGLGFMLQTSWRLTCGCCFCTLLLYFVLLTNCCVHTSFLSCSALHFGSFFLAAFLAIEQFILYQDQTIVLVCSLQILYFTEKQTKSFSIDVISLLGMDSWHSWCKWLQVWHFWLSLLYHLVFDPLASIYVSFHTRLRLQLL